MKEKQYILFDLDGTLTDSAQGITNSVAYSLDKFGIKEEPANLTKFVGPPLLESYAKYYGFSPEQCREALEIYREYYATKGIFENEVYEGIPEMLEQLKNAGKEIILATSKPEDYAKIILKHFELDQFFLYIAGSDMAETRVQKKDVIAYALESCGITDKEKVIMVGDREHDILGAKAVGLDSIGVLYGYGDYEELSKAGADHIVEKPQHILQLLIC